MTSFHQHFDIDQTGLTHNKFRAASYSSFGANRPIKQLGIVGICPVVDRTLFDTSLADFLEERLAQLKAWQSKLPVPGAPLQPSGIKRQIASLSASLSDLLCWQSSSQRYQHRSDFPRRNEMVTPGDCFARHNSGCHRDRASVQLAEGLHCRDRERAACA